MNNKIYTFEQIKKITKVVFEKYEIKKAYLFGSYARNEARADSDIDIMIVKNTSKIVTLIDLVEFENELKSLLGKKVDIVTEETYLDDSVAENKYGKLAKEIFYNQVLKDRRVLYD